MVVRVPGSSSPTDWIPLHRSSIVGRELEHVATVAESGCLGGNGRFGARCERILEESLGAPRVLLTPSCTAGLELAALLLGLEAGDEVVVPAFTFVSTANAFLLRGVRMVFVDICEDTLNLDPARLEEVIGPRTRAIVPIHYAGVAGDLGELSSIASANGIPIVEDNAHGLFATYRGRPLGTFGSLAALSFHQTKNFTCGEGGALVVNDPRFIEAAEILREKGTDRGRFLRGDVKRYTWREVGSSFLLSEIQAAFLLGQLERRKQIQDRRKAVWSRYRDELLPWSRRTGVVLPFVPADVEPAYHLFHLIMPNPETRTQCIGHLADRGIEASFHYLPLHLSSMGRRLGGRTGDHPITESVAARLLRLPLCSNLTDDEQARVIEAVLEFEP